LLNIQIVELNESGNIKSSLEQRFDDLLAEQNAIAREKINLKRRQEIVHDQFYAVKLN
jgi:hypothetical protein